MAQGTSSFLSQQFFTPETSKTDLQAESIEDPCWAPYSVNKFSSQTLHKAAKARATIGELYISYHFHSNHGLGSYVRWRLDKLNLTLT